MKIDSGTNVTATERWLDEVRRGRAYARAVSLGASVGNLNIAQLLNPAGSGRTLLARFLIGSTGAADQINLAIHNAALATLAGAGIALNSIAGVSVAEVRSVQQATNVGTVFHRAYRPANDSAIQIPDWVIELGNGEGVVMQSVTNNVDFVATFYWAEV